MGKNSLQCHIQFRIKTVAICCTNRRCSNMWDYVSLYLPFPLSFFNLFFLNFFDKELWKEKNLQIERIFVHRHFKRVLYSLSTKRDCFEVIQFFFLLHFILWFFSFLTFTFACTFGLNYFSGNLSTIFQKTVIVVCNIHFIIIIYIF